MEDIAYLFALAAQLSGLPALPVGAEPGIQSVSEQQMEALACTDPVTVCSGLQALFDSDHNRILVEDYGPQHGAEWESFVLHEIVHALQYAQRGDAAFATCTSRRAAEVQAYRVQDTYLKMRGALLRVGTQMSWWTCADDAASVPSPVER